MIKLNPYLAFAGNCEEAMNFYKDCFGGELVINRFSEGPMDMPADQKNLIMHACLTSGDFVLMASDSKCCMPVQSGCCSEVKEVKPTQNCGCTSLSLGFTSKDKTNEVFNKLAQGGVITMPLENTFWGSYFGTLTDKYGFLWMFSCDCK